MLKSTVQLVVRVNYGRALASGSENWPTNSMGILTWLWNLTMSFAFSFFISRNITLSLSTCRYVQISRGTAYASHQLPSSCVISESPPGRATLSPGSN